MALYSPPHQVLSRQWTFDYQSCLLWCAPLSEIGMVQHFDTRAWSRCQSAQSHWIIRCRQFLASVISARQVAQL